LILLGKGGLLPKKIVAVVGPTCTGKSDLSIRLAKEFGGVIINADSMQVYKHFDIGTAKPELAVRRDVRHYLIDVVEPFDEFNAGLFKEKAGFCIDEAWAQGMVPIVVGGTGLYLRALVYGLFAAPKDSGLRKDLQVRYSEDPLKFYEELKRVDPEYALRISFKDKVRVVRAMEVFRITGNPMSELGRAHGFRESHYDVLKIGLKKERSDLYSRINGRVDEMLAAGWVEEVKKIISMGYAEDTKPFSSIGYKEILQCLKGLISYADMVKDIKKQTRHYAKRQMTWFAKEKDVLWFEYPNDLGSIRNTILEHLKRGT
jgi:tRNA dimethylallyltransferase